MDEYLPPVVTKLKADLSDFVAGITEARAVMRSFARDVKADMAEATRSAGALTGTVFVTEVRKAITHETEGIGDDIGDALGMASKGDTSSPAGRAGTSVGSMFLAGMRSMLMPAMIAIVVAALPTLATAVAGAIQLGMSLGFVGLGAFMLRNEASLIAAAIRFRERVAAVFRTASAPMLVPLIRALEILGATFDKLGPSINKVFAGLATTIEPLATGIAGMFENMAPGLTAMLVAAGPVLIAFAQELPGIGSALGEFFQMIANNSPEIIMFIHDMGRIFPAVLRVVTGFLQVLIDVYGWISKLHSIMTGAGFETPFDSMETAGKAAWSWLSSTGQKIGSFFADLGKDIADWAVDTWHDIEDFGKKAGVWFSELPGKVGNWLAALPGRVMGAVQSAMDAMLYALGFGLTRAGMFLIAWIMSQPGRIGAAWTFITNKMRQNWDDFVSLAQTVPGRVGNFMSELWTTVIDWMVRTGLSIGVKAREMVDELIKWWKTAPERTGNALLDLWNMLNKWAKTFRDWGLQLGKDMIKGLIDGYLGTLDWAVNKVKDAMKKIIQGAKEALDSRSPSRVFAELGEFSMLGWVQGFLGKEGMARAAMDALINPIGGDRGYSAGQQLASAGPGSSTGTGSRDDRPLLIQLLAPNGEVMLEALIPAAQQKKIRTGVTGLA